MAYTEWSGVDDVARYAERRYRHWDQRWLDRREQAMVRRLFEAFDLRGEILDVPVGYGRFQPLLSRFGEVDAVDFSPHVVAYQQEKYGLARYSVTGRAENLPFADNSYDVVFSFRLLQHVHHPEERVAMFAEFGRVSRQWVLASMYMMSPVHQLQRRLFNAKARITMISHRQLQAECYSAGLELVKLSSVLPGLHAHRIGLFRVAAPEFLAQSLAH